MIIVILLLSELHVIIDDIYRLTLILLGVIQDFESGGRVGVGEGLFIGKVS